jgi:hypothetical protein
MHIVSKAWKSMGSTMNRGHMAPMKMSLGTVGMKDPPPVTPSCCWCCCLCCCRRLCDTCALSVKKLLSVRTCFLGLCHISCRVGLFNPFFYCHMHITHPWNTLAILFFHYNMLHECYNHMFNFGYLLCCYLQMKKDNGERNISLKTY